MSADHDVSAAPQPRPAQARPAPPRRPKYYDLSLAHLPPPGLVSIIHRITGLLLFFPLLPALLWIFDAMLDSERGFAQWREFFARTPIKLVVIAVIWAYAHHFWAGLRYLMIDIHWGVAKAPARASANAVLVLGAATALAIGWRIW